MNRYLNRSWLLTPIAWLAAGCGGEAPKPAVAEIRKDAEIKTYVLTGVVRSVAKDTHRLMIRHEEIPGFMAAMTMPFAIKDEQIFTFVKIGDTVQGALHVEMREGAVEDYELTDLKVIKAATSEKSDKPPADDGVGSAGAARLRVGEPVPDFVMTGQDGKPYALSDLRGKVVVLTFIYTRCPLPDFCPRMDHKFSELAQHLSSFADRARSVRLISLSFDPEHDTPQVLTEHGRIRGAKAPLWTYAVASHEELGKVAAPLGLTYGPSRGEVLHNLCTAIIGPDGKLARLEVGTQSNKWETTDLLKSIYSLIPKPQK